MEIRYIDCHAHMNEEIFNKDRAKILEECKSKGILVINCSGEMKTNKTALELARKFDNLKICLGIYPVQAAEISDKEFNDELKFIESNKDNIIGLGEVGLDFYWVKEDEKRIREAQRFNEIICLANKLKLPLNVHSRAAEEAIIKTLAKHAHVPVMLHSFGGDLDLANLAVKEGFYFSVAPIIVRSNKHKNLIEFLPIDRILTETDSPYLGPTKERNDPRNIPIIIEEIANIKKISTESVREQVLKNSREVFKF